MSLFRLPFILSVAIGTHISLTPPHPAPPSSERIKPIGLENIAPAFAFISKTCFWLVSFMEVAVILANIQPTSQPSTQPSRLLRDDAGAYCESRITSISLLGWFLNLMGSLVRVQCYRIMGHFFTFELSIRKDHKLITTGPYNIVRHPSYMAAGASFLGALMCLTTGGSWLAECSGLGLNQKLMIIGFWPVVGTIGCTGMISRVWKEDKILKQEFGKQWDEWARNVPYRLIPGIY